MSQVLMQFCQKKLCLGSQAGLEKHTCKRLPRVRQCPATSPVAEDLGESRRGYSTRLRLVLYTCLDSAPRAIVSVMHSQRYFN